MQKIFVGGLSWNTDEESLTSHFSKFGNIEEAKVITDRETGRSRGFGFITFSEASEAEKAVSEMDGVEIDGRSVRVNIAEDKRRSGGGRDSRGAGGGGGAGGAGRGGFGRNRW